MRRITQRKQFKSDVKRQKRRGKNIEDLVATVELLAEAGKLPAAYRPHKLSGEWKGRLGVPHRARLAPDLRRDRYRSAPDTHGHAR